MLDKPGAAPTPHTPRPASDRPARRRTAYVTGAASGIGLATARALATEGFRVVGLDRDGARLSREVKELADTGFDVVGRVADVCDRESMVRAMESEELIDVLVTAAGIYQDVPFLNLTEDDLRRMMDVNVVGTFIPAQEAARRMPAGGKIVTISSRGALGGTRFAHYVASKAAVIGLTRAMAMELREQDIAVNSIAPGFTDTPMTRAAPAEMRSAWESLEQQGHAADPAQIAHAVAFLCSPQTSFITGQTLFVDGGKSLGGLGI